LVIHPYIFFLSVIHLPQTIRRFGFSTKNNRYIVFGFTPQNSTNIHFCIYNIQLMHPFKYHLFTCTHHVVFTLCAFSQQRSPLRIPIRNSHKPKKPITTFNFLFHSQLTITTAPNCAMTADNRNRNEIIIRTPPSDVISIRCEPKRHQRSRHHPMYILDTPSRTNPTPTLCILGSTGNEYQIVLTRASITCSCPDNHPGCKHILALLHLTTTSHRRGNHIYVTPSYVIDKIQNGTLLQSNYLNPWPNRICTATHRQTDCQICDLPLSGAISSCSKCHFSHHLRCHLPPNTDTCPLCHSKLLITFMANGYRNYSCVLNHFLYPIRTASPPHMPPRPPLRPPFDNNPPPNFEPDDILSGEIIPPSPNGGGHQHPFYQL
jgi:hypothetical protein